MRFAFEFCVALAPELWLSLMSMEMAKPDTLKPAPFREWVRVKFLYPYLKSIPTHERTLDLACGYGFSFKINPNFYGIELDQVACAFNQSLGRKVKQGSLLEPYPFEDGFFDNVFSHDVLEHFALDQVPIIFKNAHRVLKRGGTFLNIVPNKKGYQFGIDINAGHVHFVDESEIKRVAEETGFRLEKVYTCPLPLFLHEAFTHNKLVTVCIKL